MKSIILFMLLIICFLMFRFLYVPWQARWGATDMEVNQSMSGDDIVENPVFIATRGVTVKATPEEIWPWIIQMGYRKAGFYSYDILDNDGIPSASQIIPAFQNLKAGHMVPLSKDFMARVAELESNQSMLLVFQPHEQCTWAWNLVRKDDTHTRLVTRLRVKTDNIFSKFMLDAFEIFMTRKCMLNIKKRAESN